METGHSGNFWIPNVPGPWSGGSAFCLVCRTQFIECELSQVCRNEEIISPKLIIHVLSL